jgi:hypothetical protein
MINPAYLVMHTQCCGDDLEPRRQQRLRCRSDDDESINPFFSSVDKYGFAEAEMRRIGSGRFLRYSAVPTLAGSTQ